MDSKERLIWASLYRRMTPADRLFMTVIILLHFLRFKLLLLIRRGL
jgi:hypothetical protein